MKLHTLSEVGHTTSRRGFLRSVGGGLAGLLLQKGLPAQLAKLVAADPTSNTYLHIPYSDDYDSFAADDSVKWSLHLLKWARTQGLRLGLDRDAREIVVPATGQQLLSLLDQLQEKYQEEDNLSGWLELDDGFNCPIHLSADSGAAVPIRPDQLVQTLWGDFRDRYIDNIDDMVKLGKRLGLKPPIEADQIVGHTTPTITNPLPGANLQRQPVQRQLTSWDDYGEWYKEQQQRHQLAGNDWSRWMDDEEEYHDKRRRRAERGEPEIAISRNHQGGMHQTLETRLRAALALT